MHASDLCLFLLLWSYEKAKCGIIVDYLNYMDYLYPRLSLFLCISMFYGVWIDADHFLE